MPVRDAVPTDFPVILAMLQEHAVSEGGLDPADGDELRAALFGERPTVFVTVAERAEAPGAVVGLALWYWMFSSWTLASGIWLDDLYVDPSYRKDGLGRELMADLRARTTGRIDWEVSAGNDAAERFYARLGAVPVPGWTRYRWLPR